jgi:hypothetical protein
MMGLQTGDQRQPFYLFNLEQRIPARAGILRPAIMSVTPLSFYCRVHDRDRDQITRRCRFRFAARFRRPGAYCRSRGSISTQRCRKISPDTRRKKETAPAD